MNPSIFTFNDEAEFLQTAFDDTLLLIKESIRKFETCRIGLAGGSTPEALYAKLADEKLPWGKITLITLDERQVPSDSKESNLRMIRESLLKKISIPPENIISFDTSLPPESSAKEMSRKLIALSHDRFPIFDLLILGAGADGHIASLFEGDEALECTKYASVAHAEGYKTPDRLSICLIALKSAGSAMLLLKGEKKLPVLAALKGEQVQPKLTALREVMEDVPTKVLAYT
ncbi:6-phosphogluconolactonase [Candidatus Peregrinibacteria bacterium]|jgi:6-phosphogluconolactonase|nr:6-phosphogluconolactonase [Candidatus Peregrinibacteria bacterium]MBT4631969.1 6-phosphogluconolactonase [Candidatus Peregrinibacteria bacterium]MBT5517057.1 6-phosphogluconolactonase [Candidatus Peregrinibacteria bacterium]MBT5823642.1 6-phosphogluconolactonase [Candidatus Peregrinibacteria bacterium]